MLRSWAIRWAFHQPAPVGIASRTRVRNWRQQRCRRKLFAGSYYRAGRRSALADALLTPDKDPSPIRAPRCFALSPTSSASDWLGAGGFLHALDTSPHLPLDDSGAPAVRPVLVVDGSEDDTAGPAQRPLAAAIAGAPRGNDCQAQSHVGGGRHTPTQSRDRFLPLVPPKSG